jgi:multicomponent Na+:H+ antiporter subunit B
MDDRVILRIGTKILTPFILIFALYVQFHGDYGPGGGFQAGVIFAAAFVLYALVYGLGPVKKVLPARAVYVCGALGVMIYLGVGYLSMFRGGEFLNYSYLFGDPEHDPTHGQHWGILGVEFGVLVTVFGVMVALFYAFAGRRRIDP